MRSLLRLFFVLFFICSSAISMASSVDTIKTYSTCMRKEIKAVVIKPDGYKKGKKFPVTYLLHGFSGNYSDWVKKVPAIQSLVDQYKVIIVCPDGDYSSWYLDSPVDSTDKYETYIGKELISFVDSHYKTIKNPTGRAITGLSMGGHGALSLAIRHQDIFGAAGSMSGCVDLRPFKENWNIRDRIGTFAQNPANWEAFSVINMASLIKPNTLALIFDCGTSDFFNGVNEDFHKKLMTLNIPHDYSSRPGGHTWEYWSNSIQYHMLYFSNYFKAHANMN